LQPSDIQIHAERIQRPEDVTWDARNRRLVVGAESGEIVAVDMAGKVSVLGTVPPSPKGLAVDGAGRVYVCDDANGQVVRLDPDSGEVETHATVASYIRSAAQARTQAPYTCAFGPEGSLYVTCKGPRREIRRVRPGGGDAEEWYSFQDRLNPNGLCVRPDGSALVVMETERLEILEIPIGGDGRAGEPVRIASIPETDPHGVLIDSEGGYWVTVYRPDSIAHVTPAGEVEFAVVDRYAWGMDGALGMTWAGDELDCLVWANRGGSSVSLLKPGVRGVPRHQPMIP
jgi:sugar lactone lactonase YvrE